MSEKIIYHDDKIFREDMIDVQKVVECLPWDKGDFLIITTDVLINLPNGLPFVGKSNKGDAMGVLFDLDRNGWMVMKLAIDFANHMVTIIVDDANQHARAMSSGDK